MSKEMSVFIEYLKKKDFKLTEQRKEILSTFLKIDKHLSVEELYDIAKKKD
ncbi:MAG: transcriptional repressor, partial [Candidatus Omnitrophica bacterium]|nr:transcriptional repressor [Candidatus Omnitrophota bacterium]